MLLQNVGTHPQGTGDQNLKQSYNSAPSFKDDVLIWINTLLIQFNLYCLYFFADPIVRPAVNAARISPLLISLFSGPISIMGAATNFFTV